MTKAVSIWAVALVLFLATLPKAAAQAKPSLRLVQTIPMPNVKGRLDHMDVDVPGERLFVAGLESGSVGVINLKTGKWARSIPGFKKPQGIAYVADLDKLFVTSGDDGTLRVFRGDTLQLVDSIKLDLGPNRIAYDPHTNVVYVGYGGKEAGKDYGEVAIIDAKTNKRLGDIRVDAHPAELLLGDSGRTLFVFVSIAQKIQVVNTQKRQIVSTWPVSSERPGDAALDERSQRLLIGTRTPPQMIAMDSRSGKEVAHLRTVDGMDGVYFDAARKRIYISGGRGLDAGYAFSYLQKDADHYEILERIPTRPGAGTSFWSPELSRYYVAAPAHDNEEAAILVYEPQP